MKTPESNSNPMLNFNTNTINKDEWLTPSWLLSRLGSFDLDPAPRHYTVLDDGLSRPWKGRIWLNPPYGRETFRWMDRLATHDGGGMALVFARTETRGFARSVWNRAEYVFFFHGRLRFWTVEGKEADAANAPSCLVYRREERPFLAALQQNGKGILVERARPGLMFLETDTLFQYQPLAA